MRFKKSTHSAAAEDCVEIALPDGIRAPGPILIRDSKRPEGPTLRVAAQPYRSFTRALSRGTLGAPRGDLPGGRRSEIVTEGGGKKHPCGSGNIVPATPTSGSHHSEAERS
ncbi:hypothetical protein B7P34_11745 [Streptosporangium nondiastaticum]|uniref:DUF397 domain-containing protein n=1 Tax=Streptosporangium nondiastaticum TaxID=35764 RepID=A0A9X7JRE6_9ACTN|nr:DUF397 domain-containing protein [Streptosporangium nondiastaticum]PSJ28533.1 hypothetical protein B7P34_11745 [Streptosporangium nondiastaticum]